MSELCSYFKVAPSTCKAVGVQLQVGVGRVSESQEKTSLLCSIERAYALPRRDILSQST